MAPKYIFRTLALIYLIGSAPTLGFSQFIADLKKDSIAYFRENSDWENYHNQINQIIVAEDAIDNENNIIDFVSAESRLLNANGEKIEAGHMWNFIGKLYAITGNFEKAVPYYERAAEELSVLNDTSYLHLVYYYHSQVIILGTNDPAKALESSTEALRLYKKRKDVSPNILGKLHYAQGWSYRGMDQYDKAIESFTKSIELSKDEDGYVETFLCRTYLEMGKHEEALQSALTANKKFEEVNNEPNHEYVLLVGRAKSELGYHIEAEKVINRSISLSKSAYNSHHTEYIKLFYFLAKAHIRAKAYDKALNSIQTIFELSYPDISISDSQPSRNISSPFPNLWVLDGLILQGKILTTKYEISKNKEDLLLALNNFDKCIEDIHFRRAALSSWKSKQEFNKYAFEAFEGAIQSSYLLYKESGDFKVLDKMINYMESSRSILLKSYQQEREMQLSILSTEQKETLDSLKRQIAEIEKAYYTAIDSSATKEIEILNKQLVEKRKDWKELIEPFSEYVSLSDGSENEIGLSIPEIQKQLKDSSVLIMYYELDQAILSIAVSNKNIYVSEIDNTIEFSNMINDLYNSLSNWESIQKSFDVISVNYTYSAKFIGNQLLETLGSFNTEINNLIIIPHGKLFSIPFGALILNDQLLIEKTSIHYALACDQINHNKIGENDFQDFFGGFAPKYKEVKEGPTKKKVVLRGDLRDLPGTRQTLIQLSNLFEGEIWLDQKATKESFLKNAHRFKLLHLAMHGQVHEGESNLSKLYFNAGEESSLTVGEIQSMHLETDMVVLSACQTNVGINKKGEGPLSLAYAFQYAGAKSILSSLWSVPDDQTSQIMIAYYSNLKKGMRKSQALKQAKTDYLKTAVGIERHPSYWAGFVIMGNDQPVFVQAKFPTLYLVLIMSFALLLFYLIQKNKKRFST